MKENTFPPQAYIKSGFAGEHRTQRKLYRLLLFTCDIRPVTLSTLAEQVLFLPPLQAKKQRRPISLTTSRAAIKMTSFPGPQMVSLLSQGLSLDSTARDLHFLQGNPAASRQRAGAGTHPPAGGLPASAQGGPANLPADSLQLASPGSPPSARRCCCRHPAEPPPFSPPGWSKRRRGSCSWATSS